MHPKRLFSLLIIGIAVIPLNLLSGQPGYEAEIDKWHEAREAELRSETGWLNLAGLIWLKEGQNTFGSDPSNDIVFPKGSPFLGSFLLEKGKVSVEVLPDAGVTRGGKKITKSILYSSGEEPPVLAHQSLRWFIIQRGDRYGIRLRDLEHPALAAFHGVERFPVDPSWQVEARLEAATDDRKIAITNVLGMTSLQTSPGTLVFQLQGKPCRLDAVWEEGELFILFSDETNGEATYGSGRFLYAAPPGPDGKTILDFNKAINPPCAFTAFATCPLPPPQNRLPLAVTAGEKNFGEH